MLAGNHLVGSIPSAIANLSSLTHLFLNTNQLNLSIPPEIGNLSNLIFLNLYINQLSGSIPAEIGNLTRLTYLSLGYNQLAGPIPPEIGNLPSLLNLYLNDNELSGVIPAEISNLHNLTNLTFGANQLSGPIPVEIGNLTNLIYLKLYNNQLTGTIPAEIGSLSNLKELYLYNNQLAGSIPPEIGNLTNLKILSLYSNQLTGDIPSAIASLAGLSSLGIEYNGLFSSDPSVRAFLEAISPGWEATQTLAPSGLTAGPVSETSITLSWTPGNFTEFTGGYRVLIATQPGGPYSLYGDSASKSIDSMIVDGLNPATPYFFVVQTWTDPHYNNQNLVESTSSAELQVTTLAPPDSDSDGLSDALENSTCTAQNNPDSDGDGIYDGVEDANRNGIQDTGETDPCVSDTDEDSLNDGLEVAAGTNPLSKDTDGDGAQDAVDLEPLNPLLGVLLGSEADLANVFHVAGLGHELGAWKSAAIRRVSFDGAGSFSMTGIMSDSTEGGDLPVSDSGAYVLGADGLGLLSAGPQTLDFALNRQKNVFVYADVRDSGWQEAGAGVLAGGSGYTKIGRASCRERV
jgi:Leucine-rich repeat (LRR) protein